MESSFHLYPEDIQQTIQRCIQVARDSLDDDLRVTTQPARVVCLQRKNGVIVQNCDVYIGRFWDLGGWQLPQSIWHNPFPTRDTGSVEESVRRYANYLLRNPKLLRQIPMLRGKVLGCWCKRKPTDMCHGDVLALITNALFPAEDNEVVESL